MEKVHVSHPEEALKCHITASAVGLKLQTSQADKAEGICALTPYISVGNETIFGANTISRYLAYSSEKLAVSELAVDQWIEWEDNALSPALSQAKKDKTKVPSLVSALLHLNEALEGNYLLSSSLSLADIVVGVTAQEALKYVQDSVPLEKVRSYTARLFNEEQAFKDGLNLCSASAAAPSPSSSSLSGTAAGDSDSADSLIDALVQLFTMAVLSAFPSAKEKGFQTAAVTRSTNPAFGEYQCNSAMQLFKTLKGEKDLPRSPAALGQAIIDHLPSKNLFEKLEVAGPGFINCHLSTQFLADRCLSILKNGVRPPQVRKMNILVDFSSPNVAKEMHVGHLRSTIIGESICRLLEFCGHDVMRVNHIGDWGTQFGMLIVHLMETFPDFKNNPPNITDLTQFYKEAKKRFDDDAEFKKRSQLQVVALQGGDPLSRELWTILCDLSRKEFSKVYNRLNVTLEEYGESYYNPIIPGVIKMLEDKGMVEVSDGARVVFVPGLKVPLMVQKRDGGFGYGSTDMAAIYHRLITLEREWVIYITDAGQWSHFDTVFRAAKLAGFLEDGKNKVDHIGFGLVCGPDGKKFKTRSGETVRLVDLLDEAKNRMRENLEERVKSGQSSLSLSEIDEAAEAIGYGAVKYFDLRQNPQSNYIFSFDRMLSTSGDTAVYLLFAHARISSIIRKSGVNVEEVMKKGGKIVLTHPSERALACDLIAFQDTLTQMVKSLQPNVLCDYLYKLSEKVGAFVTACRVIGSEEQESRILLCETTARVMRQCFTLLGITYLMQI